MRRQGFSSAVDEPRERPTHEIEQESGGKTGAVRRYDEEQFDLDRRQRALRGGAHRNQPATSSRALARCAAVYEGHLNFVTDFEGWHSKH